MDDTTFTASVHYEDPKSALAWLVDAFGFEITMAIDGPSESPEMCHYEMAFEGRGRIMVGGQWTHLFGSSIETNINGGFVQSFAGHSGIVATVTGDGTVVPAFGNQSWFEYGARVGYRITNGWVADLFLNGTAGPQPVGNTLHGGVGLRINY